MPPFRTEKPENASFWIWTTDRDITAEYIPFFGLLAKDGGSFRKRTPSTGERALRRV